MTQSEGGRPQQADDYREYGTVRKAHGGLEPEKVTEAVSVSQHYRQRYGDGIGDYQRSRVFHLP
jgi:hypothetical protein